jgi:peptide/nickel transport system substrate-binding protein
VSANAPELKIADSGLMASTTNSDPNVATTPANALTNVFDPLVKLDQQYHLQPAAADKWETPDATTWTFTIHPGISFHNGDPLTSADVKYSLDRIMNNNKDFPQFIYYSPYIDSVTTPDANTLQIKTKGSNAVLANRLSILSVVPQKYIEGQGLPNFQQHPIGSGPYKFESWTAGQSITIVRNDTYWRGKPPFPRVTFQTVTDESTRLNLIQAKQVTLADNMPANMLDSLKASGFKVANAPSAQIIFLGANCNQPPLNDIRLRQALAYAIDGDAIKKAIFSDSMLQIGSPATPLDAGYDPTIQPIPHDVAKAKQLLSAAGVATTLDISLLAGTGSNFFRVPEMAQAVAGQLQAAGIKVTLNLEAAGKSGQDYLTGTVPGLHEFTCGDIIGDVSHCTQLLFNQRALYYKSQPVIDTLVKMDQTLDATARKQLQSQALKMIAADVPWVFSYAEYHRFAMDPRLEFTEVPDGNYNMFDTRWNG